MVVGARNIGYPAIPPGRMLDAADRQIRAGEDVERRDRPFVPSEPDRDVADQEVVGEPIGAALASCRVEGRDVGFVLPMQLERLEHVGRRHDPAVVVDDDRRPDRAPHLTRVEAHRDDDRDRELRGNLVGVGKHGVDGRCRDGRRSVGTARCRA